MTTQTIHDIPKVGNFGLRNIGNTCYMASIIQLLAHSKTFINFLLSNKEGKKEYEYYLEKATYNYCFNMLQKKYNMSETQAREQLERDKFTGLLHKINEDKNNSIVHKLYEIISTSIEKGNSVIVPQSFKRVIDDKLSMFRGHQQHDSHELLLNIFNFGFI